MSPEIVIQHQVDAYNNRDIQKFIACHAPDVQLFSFGTTQAYAIGRNKLKDIYADVFENSPNLHAQIINRIVMGNIVIDHEKVTGRKGLDLVEIIAIYEVENDLISKATFIRKK